MLVSNILDVLVERILPFLPPALSVASRIVASRSMRPTLRKAVVAIDLPCVTDCVERDIAVYQVGFRSRYKWRERFGLLGDTRATESLCMVPDFTRTCRFPGSSDGTARSLFF